MKQYRIDQLSVRIYKDDLQLGAAAAELGEQYVKKALEQRGKAVIVLASASSQNLFLEAFIQKQIDWKNIIVFHLDEYIGISADHPASFRRYLHERILENTGIVQYYLIKGENENSLLECKRLEKLFKKFQVDVAFIGIGENGHIAFNEPPANFTEKSTFKIIELDEISRNQQVKEGWFKSLQAVPKKAITMTIPAIMSAKSIICSVPGPRKAVAVKHTLTGMISPETPASILRQHSDATLFLDVESGSLMMK